TMPNRMASTPRMASDHQIRETIFESIPFLTFRHSFDAPLRGLLRALAHHHCNGGDLQETAPL
ncbi:MAG: hypothetical protein ACXWQR_21155, partial [Ktedonobacterales bacterium]